MATYLKIEKHVTHISRSQPSKNLLNWYALGTQVQFGKGRPQSWSLRFLCYSEKEIEDLKLHRQVCESQFEDSSENLKCSNFVMAWEFQLPFKNK